MNPNYNQQNTIPFSTNQITNPFFQVNYNNLPINVGGVQTVQWMMPYVQLATGLAMETLMVNTQQGPLSVFLYNMMSDNGWRNQQFAGLIQDIVDYIYIENQTWQPPPHQVEHIVRDGVVNFLRIRVYGCLADFPALWFCINENDRPSVNVQVNNYQQLMGRILRMRQDTANMANMPIGQPVMYQPQMQPGMMPMGMQPMGGGYMPQGQVNRVQGHMPFTAGGSAYQQANGGVNTMAAGPGYGPQVRTASGGRDYGGAAPSQQPQQMQTQQVQQQRVTAHPGSTLVPPFQQSASAHQPTQPTQFGPAQGKEIPMNQNGTAIPVDPSLKTPDEAGWRMSLNHPELAYPPAFNPVQFNLYFKIQPDGSTVPEIHQSGINMIDYDRHAVASLFGKPLPGLNLAKDNKQVMARVDVGVAKIKSEMDEATEDKPTVLTKPKLLHDTNLEMAILTLRAEMLRLHESKPVIYRGFVKVAEPILGWEDETEQVEVFARCASYIALREELKAASEYCSPELVTMVNMRMTNHINHILRNRMSITADTVTVEDFVNDLEKLTTWLRDTFGEHIEKAFLKDQRQEIANLFQTVDRETDVYKALTGNIIADTFEDVEKKPEITLVASTYSITFLEVLSHDLQVAGVEGVGNVLLKDFQISLLGLARNILESSEQLGWGTSRHLVRTKDGRIFEITKGNINQDFILISLYH